MLIRSVIVVLMAILLITLVQKAFEERGRVRVYDANGNEVVLRR